MVISTDAPPSRATTFIPVSPSLDDTTVRSEASTAPLLEAFGTLCCCQARVEKRGVPQLDALDF